MNNITKVIDNLDKIARRLQMDIDDGSRPDQWTMEALVTYAQQSISILKSQQVREEPSVKIPLELALFLLGESAIEGKWFGDEDVYLRYWWRGQLRDCISRENHNLGEQDADNL